MKNDNIEKLQCTIIDSIIKHKWVTIEYDKVSGIVTHVVRMVGGVEHAYNKNCISLFMSFDLVSLIDSLHSSDDGIGVSYYIIYNKKLVTIPENMCDIIRNGYNTQQGLIDLHMFNESRGLGEFLTYINL